ncbi:MAG: hypothetical protein ACR2G7_13965 [Acidimicrobiales bacterium]
MRKSKSKKRSKAKKSQVKREAPARYVDFTSPNDLHLYFNEEENTEYLLCDECTEIWEHGDDQLLEELHCGRVTEEFVARALAATLTSQEVYAHACKGHDHVMCEHVLLRWELQVFMAENEDEDASPQRSKPDYPADDIRSAAFLRSLEEEE